MFINRERSITGHDCYIIAGEPRKVEATRREFEKIYGVAARNDLPPLRLSNGDTLIKIRLRAG